MCISSTICSRDGSGAPNSVFGVRQHVAVVIRRAAASMTPMRTCEGICAGRRIQQIDALLRRRDAAVEHKYQRRKIGAQARHHLVAQRGTSRRFRLRARALEHGALRACTMNTRQPASATVPTNHARSRSSRCNQRPMRCLTVTWAPAAAPRQSSPSRNRPPAPVRPSGGAEGTARCTCSLGKPV